MLRGLEGLAELGGFIKEEIEAEICEVYPSTVFLKTEKYCPLGPGFWEVADATERAYRETEKYVEYDEDSDPFELPNLEFDGWVIDQVARITAENLGNEKSSFWMDWGLSGRVGRALMQLNALDERILFLSSGIEGDKLTAKQISELPEFSCSEEYIQKVLNAIELTLAHGDWGDCEFEKICDAHRSR
jgi:hypothetical protein